MPDYSLAIDVRMWDHPGIGRYIRELTQQPLYRSFENKICFLGYSRFKKEILGGSREGAFKEVSSKIYGLAEQFEIPCKIMRADLLHVPHFNVPFLFRGKLIATIHDLIYLRGDNTLRSGTGRAYIRFLLNHIAKKAAAVITVSENTKRELLEFLPKMSSDRVFVTYEAASPIFKKIDDRETLERVRTTHQLHKPFVLFVGSLRAHKNVPALIKSLIFLREKRGTPHELILAGRMDPRNTELLDLMTRHSFVRHFNQLSDPELVSFYNLADLFVLPSFTEGFGLPVIEAMACGTPVAASNRSSLPEIVGEAGALFDPYQVDALSEVVYNVLKNRELRETMSKKGLERAKLFSWEKTARQTLEIYRQVLG